MKVASVNLVQKAAFGEKLFEFHKFFGKCGSAKNVILFHQQSYAHFTDANHLRQTPTYKRTLVRSTQNLLCED